MRRPSTRVLLLSAWAIAGCAAGPPLPVYAAPVRPDAERTLADLSRVRDLPLDAPVAIERLDDERFLRAFHARDHAASPKGKRTTAFWSAFTMASASTDVMAVAQNLIDEGTDRRPHGKRDVFRSSAGAGQRSLQPPAREERRGGALRGRRFRERQHVLRVGALLGALDDAFTASLVDGIRSKAKGAAIFDGGTRRVHLAWTVADVRALRVARAGHDLDVRLVFAPACQGKMTLILVSASKPGTVGPGTADAWLQSFHVSESSPACEALRTLRDPTEGSQ